MNQENSTYDGPVVLRSKIRYEPFSSWLSEKREERDRESDVIYLSIAPTERRNGTRGPEAKERRLCVSSAFRPRFPHVFTIIFLIFIFEQT